MSGDRDFYVGYLPIPRRHLLFLWIAAPIVASALGALAGFLSASQRDPGAGVWDTGSPITVEGTLLAQPYPMLIDDEGRTHLLVNIGKSAPVDRVTPLAGSRVAATGFRLEREGRRMLELLDGDSAIVATGGAVREVVFRESGRRITAVGEILDSKCYLGAMKPGDGKGHKACATLCVTGGIPPLLLSWNENGGRELLLLVDSDGKSANELVMRLVGEPVQVTGTLGRLGDMPTLAIGPGDLTRLGR